MRLSSGIRLGPYDIVAPIGAGGMGEVYRARDTKLNRDVALKVLPEAVAADPERLARFHREALVLASLNHPHIAAIYGFEDTSSTHALVMELVEGPTLADRIARGPIALDDALSIARQIGEALEAAHGQGIVHRDLKPANVKVRDDGTVKVLDFGLAKATDPPSPEATAGKRDYAMNSPTMTSPAMTGIGVILGTAAYMSPEQARGRPVDKRTDVWAFGCVIYEMLAGKPAFGGADVTDTIAAIVRGEPDWNALPAGTPQLIRRLLRRCLAKEARQRLPDMGSARLDIEDALAAPADAISPGAVAAPVSRARSSWTYIAIAAATSVVALLAAFAGWSLRGGQTVAPSYRASLLPPEKLVWAAGTPATRFTISPDGTRLAFIATGPDAVARLWMRSLEALAAQPLPGTEGVVTAWWSPNSRSLAFGAGGKLKRIDIAGGPPTTLADMIANQGGMWTADDVIVFPVTAAAAFSRIPAGGGTPSVVTVLDPDEGDSAHWQPVMLPDGKHFLYHVTVNRTSPNGAVYVGSLDPAEKRRLLFQGGSNAQYAMGHVLFMRESTLVAQRFDADRLELIGDAVPLVEDVQIGGSTGRTGAFSVSQTGALVYQTGDPGTATRLTWYDRVGKALGTLGEPGEYGDLELSRDGKRLSVSVIDPVKHTRDIWLFDNARGVPTRFTFDPADDQTVAWSPDGDRLVYSSRSKGSLDLYEKTSSGIAGERLVLPAASANKFPTSWSTDGRFVLYGENSTSDGLDLWMMPMTGDQRSPSPFIKTPFAEGYGRFSPDGRWVAYQSTESDRIEVFVTSFPEKNGKWRVSTAGGLFPRWTRDGHEILYLTPESKLMAAEVSGQGKTFEVGAVKPLFDLRTRVSVRYPYDVTADGQRILVNTVIERTSVDPITLLVNWPATLKK